MLANSPATGALPSMLMVQAQTAFPLAVMTRTTPACAADAQLDALRRAARPPLECFVGVIDPDSGVVRTRFNHLLRSSMLRP